MQNSVSKTSKWKDFFKKKNKIEPKKLQTENKIIAATNQIQNEILTEQSTCKQISQQIKNQNQETLTYKTVNQNLPSQILYNSTNQTKKTQQETNNCITLKQDKQKQSKLPKKQEVSKKTNKLISILQSKQKNPKQLVTQKLKECKIPQIQSKKLVENEQKAQITKCTIKLTKGHYKIYNPEHFNVTEQQIKQSTHRWTYGTGQTPNQLLISSWNVNGIRARMNANDIGPYLDFVKPDIFCINEHKMDEKSYLENPYKFWGYYSYWNFPKYSLGYSGVAIFSKYPAIQMWQDINVPQHSKQGRVITLEFDKFLLINVYIPTCGRELERLKYRVQEYDPAFREYVLELQKKYPTKTVIICGDINVAHKELDCHTGKRMLQGKQPAFTYQERSSFTVFLRQAKMVDTFRHFHPDARQYTWWNMRRGGRQRAGQTGIGKRLDYFLVDEKSLKFVKSSEIKKKVKGCDHCPIQMKIDFTD